MFIARFILIFCTLILLGACANDGKTNQGTENNEGAPAAGETVEDEQSGPALDSVTVPETLEEFKQQAGGIFVESLTLEEELNGNNDFLSDREHKKELEELLNEASDEVQLEQALVHLLGSPNYKEAIENVENFSPDFDEPLLPDPEKQTTEGSSQPAGPPDAAIILLDASSSMLLPTGNDIRMNVAKDAVSRFAKTVAKQSDVSLVVYGHKGSESNADKQLSCSSIDEVFPLGTYAEDGFNAALASFESKGWTPLAGAIEKAAEMTSGLSGNITVYIVSDGVETCDGDPVAAAKVFADQHEENYVNIIGFQVNQEAEDQLKKVAEAGNGEYFYAENAEDIVATMEEKWILPSTIDLAWAFQMAPGPWEQLAEFDKVKAEAAVIRSIMDKEKERFDAAFTLMSEEQWLDSERIDEVRRAMDDRYYQAREWIGDLQSEKIAEIESRAKEIRARVDEWTERMREMKREQGDIW